MARTVYALLGGFRWPNVVPTRHALGAGWFRQNTGKKVPKSTVAKAKLAGLLKTRLIEQQDDITISNSSRVC